MSNWIKTLYLESKKEKICTRIPCWCQTYEFRCKLTIKSCKEAGIPIYDKLERNKEGALIKPRLDTISNENCETCIKVIAKELSLLTPNDVKELNAQFPQPLISFFYEIHYPHYRVSGGASKTDWFKIIEEIVKDNPAGNFLNRMKEHSRQRDEAGRKHSIINDPKNVAIRRKEKREKKVKAHLERIEKYKKLGNRLKKK